MRKYINNKVNNYTKLTIGSKSYKYAGDLWLVKYNKQQIWEAIIIIAIILFFTYRLALAYDYIPYEYQPSIIISENYTQIKTGLLIESEQEGWLGYVAKSTLDTINAIETYVKNKKDSYAKAEEVATRCHENMIFRFFMFMGDEDNQNCTEQNILLENAVKGINASSNPTPNTPPPAQQ